MDRIEAQLVDAPARDLLSNARMIAIVDDDSSVRRALSRLLRASGYAVATFASGEALIEALPQLALTCLVMDLHMPRVDGFDVLAALAGQSSAIPVIAVTADTDPRTAERARASGAVECLPKPVDESALLRLIGAAQRP